MDKKEILEFITKNPTAYMATVEGNRPHVRGMGTFRADENGIIFAMQSDKNVYAQVMKNPETEICYFAEGTQIRVSGQLQPVDDMDLKKEIAEARPFYKPGIEEHGWGYVGAFKVVNAKASILNMGKPGPMTYVDM